MHRVQLTGGAQAAETEPLSLPVADGARTKVLRLVAAGLNTPRIARRLALSEHTVKRHVANVLMKLELSTRATAVAEAARLGILGPPG
jgi:DNA-binding NarL/FixJ family response regulator